MPESDNPQVDETPTDPAPSEGTVDFEKWLGNQPEHVRQSYAAHTSGLKSALDAERAKAKETARKLKKLEELEAKEQERKEAEMTEMEKLQASYAKLQAQLKERELTDLKRTIAAEVGLPEALALRIQGDDAEAMKADAELLREALPADEQQAPKSKPKISPTNPASGQPAQETSEARRNRIFGGGGNIFDPAQAEQRGGGVRFQSDIEK